jgi:hypothetical protein
VRRRVLRSQRATGRGPDLRAAFRRLYADLALVSDWGTPTGAGSSGHMTSRDPRGRLCSRPHSSDLGCKECGGPTTKRSWRRLDAGSPNTAAIPSSRNGSIGRPTTRTIKRRWGWEELTRAATGAGARSPKLETRRQHRLELLLTLRRAREELGRWPTAGEWEASTSEHVSRRSYVRQFGSVRHKALCQPGGGGRPPPSSLS